VGTSRSRTPSEKAWIDICVPLRRGMVHWPDNLPVRVERMLDMECSDVFTSRQSRWGAYRGALGRAAPHGAPAAVVGMIMRYYSVRNCHREVAK
jgi:hypothetical protein